MDQHLTIDQALIYGARHYQAGRFAEAEKFYSLILATDPNHAESLHRLALCAASSGTPQRAADLLRRAIALQHRQPLFHANLGLILAGLGQTDDAITAYLTAIRLKPDLADPHNNIGILLAQAGRLDDAILAYSRAIQFNPNYAEAYNNLGNALVKKNRLDEAIIAYRQAVRLKPSCADAHHNLGGALQKTSQLGAAVQSYRAALSLRPQFPEALNSLGAALRDQDSLPAAVEAFDKALLLRPDYFEAIYNLAVTQFDLGQLDAALALFHRAGDLRPDNAMICMNIAGVLKEQGLLDESLAWYDKSIAADPADHRPHTNRVYLQTFHPGFDSPTILRELRQWNARHAHPFVPASPTFQNDRAPDRRLKIGYVSPNFRDHCQSFFTVPLFSHHDRGAFDIFCYSDTPKEHPIITPALRQNSNWRQTIAMTDEDLACQIRADNIDILVDLTMHIADTRLLTFARRPAPIQVTWLAYPGSTGVETIGYRLTDPFIDPEGQSDNFYSEKSIRLPDTFWCYDPLTTEPRVNDLPAASADHVTFGCLNNFCKLNPRTLDLWAKVLTNVPRSRLLLRAPLGESRQRVLDHLARQHVENSRVEFVTRQPREKYLELFHRIDIALDTFPYNGHTTSLDGFWMGVPVITVTGRTAVGRAGFSQLSNRALGELVASDEDAFVTIAANLARDLPHLAQLRATLRQRMEKSPLMDAPRFARNIEAAYRQMWREWTPQ